MQLIRQSETLNLRAELYMQEYSNLSSLPSAFLGNLSCIFERAFLYNEKAHEGLFPHCPSISFDV